MEIDAEFTVFLVYFCGQATGCQNITPVVVAVPNNSHNTQNGKTAKFNGIVQVFIRGQNICHSHTVMQAHALSNFATGNTIPVFLTVVFTYRI